MTAKTIRCAIYTRKSSDEGLDQEFNSLDAQREAGEAFIKSQAHEGWQAIATQYDDGGFSGGTMERPALLRLLGDVDAGLVDVVVVYKIDRLTRSLPDFARIVERFDAQETSFVSVTQSFNTTSSMGRLTLNVLLSFAQFEREVTGERIRDKIAASKAKGKWMGGILPLGYDLAAPGSRTLVPNRSEANTVKHIFDRYLALGSVHALQRELEAQGIVSKQWVTRKGKVLGGLPFSRGALFHLLRNPVYLGKIRQKDTVHEGEHQPVLDADLFDAVQAQLDTNARRYRAAPKRRQAKAPLTGRLFDAIGEAMSPSTSHGSKGKLYRYYVSTSLLKGSAPATSDDIVQRVAARGIEAIVHQCLARLTKGKGDPLRHLKAAHIQSDALLLDLADVDQDNVAMQLDDGERIVFSNTNLTRIEIPVMLPIRGGKTLIVPTRNRRPQPDPVLIEALRKAHRMIKLEHGFPILETAPISSYDRKILRLAFLAPQIQRDIITGLQPPSLNLHKLQNMEIPLYWKQQHKALGWPQSDRT